MANVLNRTTLEYRASVNTADYPPSDWLINPDLSAVAGLDPAFWIVDAQQVRPRTDAERLPILKDRKLQALDAWWTARTASGVTVGALALDASPEAQGRFTSLATMEQLALAAGAKTGQSESGLADRSGVWHTMTVTDAFAVLLEYATACAALSRQYASRRAAIVAASTPQELDALEL
jgi:hypothetical protein